MSLKLPIEQMEKVDLEYCRIGLQLMIKIVVILKLES